MKKKQIFSIFLVVITCHFASAQCMLGFEQRPEFPGGDKALLQYIANNLKQPAICVEGKVFVSFTVEKDGSVSSVKVLRGIEPHSDSAAIAVVRTLPKFKPGIQNKKPVRVQYNLPIRFGLNRDETSMRVYTTVDKKPEFEGGEQGLKTYLETYAKLPLNTYQSGSASKVSVSFIVEKDGSITDVKLLRGIVCSASTVAIDLVKKMPKFSPAKQNGEFVRYYYTLDIMFNPD